MMHVIEYQIHKCTSNVVAFYYNLWYGTLLSFGNKAVTDFLQEQGFSYIMRAHEAHAEGVAVSKGARVFTVFSTSRDHNQGSQALAGCILVDDERLQVINRSPAYKNQYVHRRDSLSLQQLTSLEIAKRIKLGLVTPGDNDNGGNCDDDDDENWEDFSSDEEVTNEGNGGNRVSIDDGTTHLGQQQESSSQKDHQQYIFAQGRRSSVDLSLISDNIHDVSTSMDVSGSLCGSGRNLRESLRGTSVAEEEDGDEDSTVNGDDVDESMGK